MDGGPKKWEPRPEPSVPSMRQRRPVMFWIVVIAVLAMVLSTIAGALGAIL